ncbi:GntR family transcriptional regulator [Listeria booriae]|uniref:GntR family transcriptional regulator n=1 Tax=Listeria booriae TaxID=1552123 RepID=A0A7X0Z317_9LIST|nr:GntR family transcriptional regulator [Listeria booriae]MBC2175047.1 GntR family transcriptional regulator [Listeria booriae]
MNAINSLKGEAYEYLSTQIKNNNIQPNTRINETLIATHLNMSRTPVRQAIYQLEKEGEIEHRLYQGFYVREKKIDIHTYINLLDVLTLLIKDAVSTTRYKDEDFQALDEKIEEAVYATDHTTYLRNQMNFFLKLLEIKGNQFAYTAGNSLCTKLENLSNMEVKEAIMEAKQKTIIYMEKITSHLRLKERSLALQTLEDMHNYYILQSLKRIK